MASIIISIILWDLQLEHVLYCLLSNNFEKLDKAFISF